MKKTFILLAMFILTIGLIGCSSDTTESEDTIEQVEKGNNNETKKKS